MNTKKHSRQKYHALILATAILTLNFWAWSLLSPLATTYKEIFQLSPVAVSFFDSYAGTDRGVGTNTGWFIDRSLWRSRGIFLDMPINSYVRCRLGIHE